MLREVWGHGHVMKFSYTEITAIFCVWLQSLHRRFLHGFCTNLLAVNSECKSAQSYNSMLITWRAQMTIAFPNKGTQHTLPITITVKADHIIHYNRPTGSDKFPACTVHHQNFHNFVIMQKTNHSSLSRICVLTSVKQIKENNYTAVVLLAV